MIEYIPVISFAVGYLLSQLWIEFRESSKDIKLNTPKADKQFHATREFIASQCAYVNSLQHSIAGSEANTK